MEGKNARNVLEGLTGATNKLEIWTGRLECTCDLTGRRANRLEVQPMWVQHMSNEDILKVHQKTREEHEADVLTKQLSQSIF